MSNTGPKKVDARWHTGDRNFKFAPTENSRLSGHWVNDRFPWSELQESRLCRAFEDNPPTPVFMSLVKITRSFRFVARKRPRSRWQKASLRTSGLQSVGAHMKAINKLSIRAITAYLAWPTEIQLSNSTINYSPRAIPTSA